MMRYWWCFLSSDLIRCGCRIEQGRFWLKEGRARAMTHLISSKTRVIGALSRNSSTRVFALQLFQTELHVHVYGTTIRNECDYHICPVFQGCCESYTETVSRCSFALNMSAH